MSSWTATSRLRIARALISLTTLLLPGLMVPGLPSSAMSDCDVLFGPAVTFHVGPSDRYLAVGDFNEDGLPDLAVPFGAGADSAVAVLLGIGGGVFAAPVYYPAGSVPSQVVTGDFNKDGITDLAVANKGIPGSVSILLGGGAGGVGDGTFAPGGYFITIAGSPFGIVAADLDGDGNTDLATTLNFGNAVQLLKGAGNGAFTPVGTVPDSGTNSGIAVGDFNHDGALDLVAGKFDKATLMLAFGTGSHSLGSGSFGTPIHVPVGPEPFGLGVADLNSDGNPDLIVAHTAYQGIQVLLGSASGAFTLAQTIDAGNCTGAATADFDHDGVLDLATGIVTGVNDGAVEVYRGHGDGTFGALESFRPHRDCYGLVAADLDANGTSDLAVTEGYGNDVGILLGACAASCPLVPVNLKITPNVFNLKSLGHWATGVLEPEPPASPADIDIASIRLNGTVPVDPSAPTSISNGSGNSRPDLTVKFDRAAVEATLTEGDSVPVTVTGTIGTGCFVATDFVKVRRGHVASPAAGAALQAGTTTGVNWETPNETHVQSVAVLFSGDDGASWSLEAHGLPNSGSYDWLVPVDDTDRARIAVVLVEETLDGEYVVQGVLAMSDRFTIASTLDVGRGTLDLALQPISNPGRTLGVSLTLPNNEPATLVAYDVVGREVSRREVRGMGRHVVTLGADVRLVPGTYLVQLIQGERRRTTRAVVIR